MKFGDFIKKIFFRQLSVKVSKGHLKGLKLSREGLSADYAQGNNEWPIQDLLATILKNGDVFFDIGANIGYFSLLAARLVGNHGEVFSFEPVTSNLKILKQNIKLNGFTCIKIIPKALADKRGKATLLLTRHHGGATLSSLGISPPDVSGEIEVELETIDDLMAEEQLRIPKLIKLDVEGAEMVVLKGMEKTLKEHHPALIYELDSSELNQLEVKAEEVQEYLAGFGYQVDMITNYYPDRDWYVRHFIALLYKKKII